MSVQKYPRSVTIFKGEGRIFIVPLVRHIGGYSVDSEWFIKVKDMEDSKEIGNAILKAFEFIENNPISTKSEKEQQNNAAWRKNSKYKSWVAFWKNNYCADFNVYENGEYQLNLTERMLEHKGVYNGSIKKISMSSTSSEEEIGKAVIDIFKVAEGYQKDKLAYDPYPSKKLALLDDSTLTIKHPKDKHFNDDADSGAAEIYQCYSYLPKEDAESSAEFFIGTAFELDCDLASADIHKSWEEFYGKPDFFEIQECNYGIYKLRAEMRNKETHKISYFLQIDEDSILECGMGVHQPNRRKKLDERLVELFQEFTLNCKR